MRKKLSLLFFFINIVYVSIANTCTSSAGTFASWPAITWSCSSAPTGGPPGCGDVMNVAAGTYVYVSADVNFSACGSPITLNIYGTLDFNTNGIQFKLPPGSTVFVGAGGTIKKTFAGGGSSTLISVGTQNVWTAGAGTVTGPIVLPIELLSFSAQQNTNKVDLKWATASEVNNDYFTVEKTIDFLTFEQVAMLDGAGTSTNVIHYAISDYSPNSGLSYYRLKQTDYNGDFAYSSYVSVYFKNSTEFSFELYPNPSDGENLAIKLQAEKDKEILVVVYDLSGRESYSKVIVTSADGENVYAIDPSYKLSPGMYMVTATSDQSIHSKRLIVK